VGGAASVVIGTEAGKELGQAAGEGSWDSEMPNRAQYTEEINRSDQAGLPASIGTGTGGAAIDTRDMAASLRRASRAI
jgi:hypothetical protein